MDALDQLADAMRLPTFGTKAMSQAKVVAEDDGTFTLEAVAQTETVDRDGEVILAVAMEKALPAFLENGPVLFGHNPRLDYEYVPPIGHVVAGSVREGVTTMTMRLQRSSPVAKSIAEKRRIGIPVGTSIGYITEDEDKPFLTGQTGRTITALELLELSFTPMQSNRTSRVKRAAMTAGSQRLAIDFPAEEWSAAEAKAVLADCGLDPGEPWDLLLSEKDVREFSPLCADAMTAKGLKAISAAAIRDLRPEGKPGDPGFFTRCLQSEAAQRADNPEAFCAWLHHQILGTWPGEHRGIFRFFVKSARPGRIVVSAKPQQREIFPPLTFREDTDLGLGLHQLDAALAYVERAGQPLSGTKLAAASALAERLAKVLGHEADTEHAERLLAEARRNSNSILAALGRT